MPVEGSRHSEVSLKACSRSAGVCGGLCGASFLQACLRSASHPPPPGEGQAGLQSLALFTQVLVAELKALCLAIVQPLSYPAGVRFIPGGLVF